MHRGMSLMLLHAVMLPCPLALSKICHTQGASVFTDATDATDADYAIVTLVRIADRQRGALFENLEGAWGHVALPRGCGGGGYVQYETTWMCVSRI